MNADNDLFGPDIELHKKMYTEIAPTIIAGPWHWFSWLFQRGPRRPFVAHLIKACAECELKLPGLGWSLLRDVAAISGLEKHKPHYDMLMQKLSEILVLRELLYLPWANDAIFEHEPTALTGGKRPELKVETENCIYLFEVKAPSLLEHQKSRSANPIQFPGRMFDTAMRDLLARKKKATLPRDNPIKDFLISAESKFEQFESQKQTFGVLIIVWDDFIYEPITSLVHEPSQGLLTSNSFAKDKNGNRMTFVNIDAVILVRHLMYFNQGSAEKLTERKHAFDFGGPNDLPNVYIPTPLGKPLPEFLIKGLRALHYNDDLIKNVSEYNPQEYIMWFNV